MAPSMKNDQPSPVAELCRLVGEEDMRNEPQWQADDADVQHQRIEKQQVNDAAAGPRTSAEAEVYQGQHHAREGDDQGDHFGEASTLGAPIGMGARLR